MYYRREVESLGPHLEAACGVKDARLRQLDVGVLRVDHADRKRPLVARLFSERRPFGAAEGDLAVLCHLAEADFPAERPIAEHPLTTHEGQAVLATGFIKDVPKAKRPPGGVTALGRLIGRLHTMPVPAGADRPSGALHHFAEGTLQDELHAVGDWLDSVESRVPVDSVQSLDVLHAAVATADGGEGLPEAFVHPDPVPKNAVFTAEGPVLVDWTSAGRGPRLPSMTLILRSGWAARPFMSGYAEEVSLTEEERGRLPELLFTRSLIDLCFRVCLKPETTTAAKKLSALRRDSDAKAREALTS